MLGEKIYAFQFYEISFHFNNEEISEMIENYP